jgi:hypothetical protein
MAQDRDLHVLGIRLRAQPKQPDHLPDDQKPYGVHHHAGHPPSHRGRSQA